jgi:hypothetical protein
MINSVDDLCSGNTVGIPKYKQTSYLSTKKGKLATFFKKSLELKKRSFTEY